MLRGAKFNLSILLLSPLKKVTFFILTPFQFTPHKKTYLILQPNKASIFIPSTLLLLLPAHIATATVLPFLLCNYATVYTAEIQYAASSVGSPCHATAPDQDSLSCAPALSTDLPPLVGVAEPNGGFGKAFLYLK